MTDRPDDASYRGPYGAGWGPAEPVTLFPAPPGVPALQPHPVAPPPVRPTGRSSRLGTVVLVAALTALVVGPVTGYAGARLADRGTEPGAGPTTAPTTAPSSEPTVSRSPVDPPPDTADTVAIAAKLLPSTVTITVSAGDRGGTGSGFVLDDRGRVMTNNHVANAAGTGGRIEVRFSDGRRSAAKVLGRSPSYDLAVLQVSDRSALSPVQIGDSDATRVGEPAIAIGSPLGLGGTVTEGIISAKDRPVVVSASASATPTAYLNALQTDAPINPGNSGGPLVDAGGRVIGVNSAILTLGGSSGGQTGNIGLGFSIPINQAITIGNQLISDGKATYPVIGAEVEDTDDETGVRLRSLTGGGPAADAGLRKGDVVRRLDGAPVDSTETFIVAVRSHRPQDVITLTYDRSGSSRTARVTLGAKEG